ncbi:sperm acrosome developmental regulator [Erinaceus europaeus]|uniref:Sperm acrosome developmental regulator n=1 Tax=Erinaceus europaeus TaxID=9365 RepID=A0ABM3VYH6_ERIEU|nr:sperm acrosome developmental regulator [Erinaceus europaeus]
MAVVMRFFWWVWRKFTHWVFFWKHKVKLPEAPGLPDSVNINLLGAEKAGKVTETLTLVQPLQETTFLTLEELPKLVGPCAALVDSAAAAGTGTGAPAGVELAHGNRSLLQLPRTAVKSVSTLMVSALQSGWQKCTWKSSVSSTSVTSQIRTSSSLESPEAEMLREVYLVLWAMRKQLRQLARRQERRRQRHLWARSCAQPDPAPGLKQEVRSPL